MFSLLFHGQKVLFTHIDAKCVSAIEVAVKMALELVLKSLLCSSKFTNSSADEKDWGAISKLIPGVTPKEVSWFQV